MIRDAITERLIRTNVNVLDCGYVDGQLFIEIRLGDHYFRGIISEMEEATP